MDNNGKRYIFRYNYHSILLLLFVYSSIANFLDKIEKYI